MSASIPKLTNPQLAIGSASCFVAAIVCSLLSGGSSHASASAFAKTSDTGAGGDTHNLASTDKNIAWNFGALQAAIRIMPGHLT